MNASHDQFRIIALDGPAGSGKSSIAAILAEKLRFIHTDSGAIYRSFTLALMDLLGQGDSPDQFGNSVEKASIDYSALSYKLVLTPGGISHQIAGHDTGARIRSPDVTARIRYVADNRSYRKAVNRLLRDFSLESDIIVDGRDIGTVVFPEASFKFFITASSTERARRRLLEFESQGITNYTISDLEVEIQLRDSMDEKRAIGALKQAEDAILIDTSGLDIDGVVLTVMSYLQIIF